MLLIGNYWDWAFPFFEKQLQYYPGFFSWSSFSSCGSAMNYFTSYYFNIVISKLNLLFSNTETIVLLLLFVTIFLYLFYINRIINTKIISLVAVFSTVMFYKLLAGHYSYIISLVIFAGFLHWLLNNYKKNLQSAVILGLFLAFVGAQIQFFVFAGITLLIFFLLSKEKFKFRYFALSLIIAFLVNLPWLSNYLIGANSVTATSNKATEMLFGDSSFASPLRILSMTFSVGTNIQYIYAKPWLAYFGIFSILTICSVLYYFYARRKISEKNDQESIVKEFHHNSSFVIPNSEQDRRILFFIINWIVFSILGTGYFHLIPIPFLKTFYPMFRESGHFVPIIVLFQVLTFASTWKYLRDGIVTYFKNYESRIMNKENKNHNSFFQIPNSIKIKKLLDFGLIAYLLIFISINAYYMVRYLPRVDFAKAREKFQQFEDFGQTDTSVYRVLTYPFWNQYGFIDTPNVYKNGRLINNSGWDSYIAFSGKDSISNYTPGGKNISNTLQYRLIKTLDISELEKRNVKYLYDFSGIYESNFNEYTTPDTYNYDIKLIKNDPEFFNKLIEANQNKIVRVTDKIYQLKDAEPRIYLSNDESKTIERKDPSFSPQDDTKMQLYFQKVNPTKYRIYIKGLKDKAELNFLENYHKNWKLYLAEPSEKSEINSNNQIPNWCKGEIQKQNNSTTECLEKQKFTEWNELKYLRAEPFADETHTKYDNYGNRWTIDAASIKELGSKNQELNIKNNNDGSIDVELTMYFWPQTPFYLAIALSLLTVLSIIAYFVCYRVMKRIVE